MSRAWTCGIAIALFVKTGAAGLFAASGGASEDLFAELRCDADKVVGVDACLKCHEKEIGQWQTTPHFQTFDTLHRSEAAKTIAKKLGLRSVKRNETCLKCHYTCQEVDGKTRVIAGVSCESCHGGAKDWIELHNDYGGPHATRESESLAHRRQRVEDSIAAGMKNPQNIYLIARQCLSCHTSPDEELVNKGGHVPGSQDFELVSWSQGMVRHNFLRSGGASNEASSQDRLRVMYVVGVLADMEASLRATATATQKAEFGIRAAQRAARQKKRLYEICELVDNSYLKQAMEAVLAVRLKLNNREELTAAADRVGKAASEFAVRVSGADLAAIDPLLPTAGQYRWTPASGGR